jgi:hypothetical protein
MSRAGNPSYSAVTTSSSALPSGAATEATLSAINTKVPSLGQALAASSVPVVLTAAQLSTLTPPAAITGYATEATLATRLSESDFDTKVGSLTETAPATDTASSGLNGRLQRIAQRITSLIALLPAALTGSGNFKVSLQESNATQAVSGTVTANQGGTWTVQPGNTANTTAWKVDGSAVTQPVSGTVTANAGTNLNTSALALESGGNLASTKTNTDNLNLAQASTTSGQKGNLVLAATTTGSPTYTTAQSNPLSLTIAGALRVDGSAVTQPVSGTVTITPSGTQSVNVAQIAGTTTLTGNGVTGAGSQRVTVASDNTPFPIKIDQTTVGTTNAMSVAQLGANTVSTGNGASGTGVLRVAQVNDGTGVLATVSTVTSLTQMNGQAIAMNTGTRSAGTQRVTIATDDVVPASQSGTWNIATVSTLTALGSGTTGPMKAEDVAHATGDQGFPAWAVRNDNLATTFGADQDYIPISTDLKGAIITTQKAATPTQSSVAGSATSVTLLSANSSRRGAVINNDSTATLYVKMGATASTTSYSYKMLTDDILEIPYGYTGVIDGIWASATGNARITELT